MYFSWKVVQAWCFSLRFLYFCSRILEGVGSVTFVFDSDTTLVNFYKTLCDTSLSFVQLLKALVYMNHLMECCVALFNIMHAFYMNGLLVKTTHNV